MNSRLTELEEKSIFILREAKAKFKKPAVLWSMGKDSTVMLMLCKKAFLGNVPFPAINIDSGRDFPESYEFKEKMVKEWGINLLIAQAEHKKDAISGTAEGLNKAEALKKLLEKEKFDALIVSIRRDEHGVRAKERYVSPRDKNFRWDFENQPPEIFNYTSEFKDASHVRIHPLLHWNEVDIWEYSKANNIPVNPLYFAKNGKRYRSIGYADSTVPFKSNAKTIDEIIKELKTTDISERAGRAQDKEKEYVMQRLRELGYM
ncbi:sulfate adenylyltransferase subunit CysD [Patescibacteria group bacterium AH-259-L05]|nr:sulfate adenylyltransferase subunit CysD [Patescibacteria group bacterium AH-259-L05]